MKKFQANANYYPCFSHQDANTVDFLAFKKSYNLQEDFDNLQENYDN